MRSAFTPSESSNAFQELKDEVEQAGHPSSLLDAVSSPPSPSTILEDSKVAINPTIPPTKLLPLHGNIGANTGSKKSKEYIVQPADCLLRTARITSAKANKKL